MDLNDIQAYRKQRLRLAIDAFFGGSQVALARKLRNRDGEFLKDGSYISQMLRPMSDKNARSIEEDRIREIEGLLPGLAGWFNLPLAMQQHKGAQSDRSNRPSFAPNELPGKTLISQEIGKKPHLIPVTPQPLDVKALNWEQLMDTILKEGLGFLGAGVWVEVGDDANGDDLLPGDQVFLQSGIDPVAQDFVLVVTKDGEYLLRKYRKITSRVFEAWAKNEGYGKLRSDADGIQVVAVVMERKLKRRTANLER